MEVKREVIVDDCHKCDCVNLESPTVQKSFRDEGDVYISASNRPIFVREGIEGAGFNREFILGFNP